MARPPHPLGTWGKITRTPLGPNRWRARAWYRDYDGVTRPVDRYAETGAKAERALTTALSARSKAHGDSLVTPDTQLEDLARLWLDIRRREHLSTGTLDLYEQTVRTHIRPGVGRVRVREATVGVCEVFLAGLASKSVAHRCRVVLSGMMKLAAQHDAIERNPVRDTTSVRPAKKEVRTLTVAELAQLRARIAAYAGSNQYGRPRAPDLPDLFDVWLGTGGRINEVLPACWGDVAWGGKGEPTRLTLHRSKGGANDLVLTLPAFAVAALRRQKLRALPGDLIFPSASGTVRGSSNVQRQLRAARRHVVLVEGERDGPELLFEWVTPHTCRRTVATMIAAEHGAEAAAEQLGHSSPEVTRAHYIERSSEAADRSATLDGLAPLRALPSTGST